MSGIDKAHDKDTGAMVAETGPAAIYDAEKNVPDYGSSQDDVYDPSQETLMTRLGLTWESLKRAPGSTRSVPGRSCSIAAQLTRAEVSWRMVTSPRST